MGAMTMIPVLKELALDLASVPVGMIMAAGPVVVVAGVVVVP